MRNCIVLLMFLVLAVSTTASAGFISIDEFTDAAQSDGLGVRTFVGDVKVSDDAASMVSGIAWLSEIATITYDFLPAPLVVKPKFVLRLKNNQTTYLESGILRATINGRTSLERELFADKDDYETVVFDFIGLIPVAETVSEFSLNWIRPDAATGARELLIDSISVSDVPEPRSLSLIGSALGAAVIMRRRRNRVTKGKVSTTRKRRNIYRY